MAHPIISAEDTMALLDDQRLVLLDVRWRLGQTDGHEQYLAEHLPGAVFVDLDTQLAAPPEPALGRHPLPSALDFAAVVASWGVTPESVVVIYDDWKSLAAARAWWLLDAAGHPDVRVLDGGIRAWRRAGFATETGEATATPAEPWVTGFGDRVLDADAAWSLAQSENGVLLDARASERYNGSTEPIDPRAGHIPGARNAPTTDNVDADGLFLDPAALRERFDGIGATSVGELGVYCGSGVTASHELLALRLAGIDAALYAGSWSQWSSLPERPIAIGDSPS
jgi:thiosulfate/3-mercaptopyruvate sulfurtransferase